VNGEPTARSSPAATWTVTVVALLIVYLLSPGPFFYWQIRLKRQLPLWLEDSLPPVYMPIRYSLRCKPVRDAYTYYLSWCAGEPVPLSPPP
jgi:hypothetical protein